jgi:hypothetical protein
METREFLIQEAIKAIPFGAMGKGGSSKVVLGGSGPAP